MQRIWEPAQESNHFAMKPRDMPDFCQSPSGTCIPARRAIVAMPFCFIDCKHCNLVRQYPSSQSWIGRSPGEGNGGQGEPVYGSRVAQLGFLKPDPRFSLALAVERLRYTQGQFVRLSCEVSVRYKQPTRLSVFARLSRHVGTTFSSDARNCCAVGGEMVRYGEND